MHVLFLMTISLFFTFPSTFLRAESRPSTKSLSDAWERISDLKIKRACALYFDAPADRQFCEQITSDYRLVEACSESFATLANRRVCVDKHNTYLLMINCRSILVDESRLLKCIKHTQYTSTIIQCAEAHKFQSVKTYACLKFHNLTISHPDFDVDFSNDTNLSCTRRNGENITLKGITLKRGDDGQLLARYKTDSGFFLIPNPSSPWFRLPNTALAEVNRALTWKLADNQELSLEDAGHFFQQFLLPTIRQDSGQSTVVSCRGPNTDLAHPSSADDNIMDSGRQPLPGNLDSPTEDIGTDPAVSH